MMNIAICDDDERTVELIKEKISTVIKSCDFNFEYKINSFKDGANCMQHCFKEYFDIIFLDIEMPVVSGFDIAERVRSFNPYTIIIFVTARDDLVFQSIKYKPFRFIQKSDINLQLFEAINACLEYYRLSMKEKIFQFEDGTRSINVSNIRFIETYGHDIKMHFNDGTLMKMKKRTTCLNLLENELKGQGFIRTHRSYLVNYKSIYLIMEKKVVLKKIDTDNAEVSVYLSRDRAEEVKLKYQMFLVRE